MSEVQLPEPETQVPLEQVSGATQPELLLHEVGQVLSVPSQTYWPQPVPADPAVTGEQIPSSPESAHESQPSAHVALQQTPSAQIPDVHCRLSAQVAPLFCAGAQVPDELQKSPVWQLVSAVHVVGQLAEFPVQRYGAHDGEPA